MCPLCEEPLRSILFGLSAIGVVAIVRTVQKFVKRYTSKDVSLAPADGSP